MNQILKRTLSGLTAGLLVVGLFLYCPLRVLMPIVAILAALAQLEFYQMAKKKYEPVVWFGILMGIAWMTVVGLFGFGIGVVFSICGFCFAFPLIAFVLSLIVIFNSNYRNPVGTIASTLAGFFYVPFLMSFFLLIAQLNGHSLFQNTPWISRTGLYTLFALIAVTKFSDTGGYAFGLAFGKHKMCPSISPKKSWEGLVGSMLFSAIVAVVFLAIARNFSWSDDIRLWGRISYPVAMLGGAFLALVGTAGDLIESRFKREFEVKDSATFMPAGQGGFLDMFDSVLFIPAIAYPILLTCNQSL
ncbi:MAG: phosphatidate cytidylyltransferase [Kiritimatiellae bacterium]|nr:phosphatidate cytidylyltransferase [Kiritimatiellia bacterium]